MSECESKFGVGDRVVVDVYHYQRFGQAGTIKSPSGEYPGKWLIEFDNDKHKYMPPVYGDHELKADVTPSSPEPVALPGGDDCCNKPLPDFFGEPDAPEPAPPDGYDRELLEIQLASVHRALSVAHAGLIATPVETVAPTLALGMAMESIESLIRDVRGE